MFLKRQVRWSGIPILLQNFPQFIVIHTVKSFGIVNKAEIDGETKWVQLEYDVTGTTGKASPTVEWKKAR